MGGPRGSMAAVKFVHLGGARPRGPGALQAGGQRALARLSHPNIARLLDAGVTDLGQPFLVIDFVDGVPLIATSRRAHGSTLEARLRSVPAGGRCRRPCPPRISSCTAI